MTEIEARAREIAAFFRLPVDQAIERLSRGFGYQHEQVAADWRRVNPQTDQQILEWYRSTDAYVWELTAYHIDSGFNYSGMIQGIAQRLTSEHALKVLCLGDGIGDLTLGLWRVGFEAKYHDLKGSVTEKYASFHFVEQTRQPQPCALSETWDAREIVPEDPARRYHAVVSLDYLEHVTDVPAWARAIYDSLYTGGILCAQNAFAMGSGESGSMPMHLARNDRFERDWDPLLAEIGFEQLSSNWYRKR